MANDDLLIREVDEELRRDRMRKLWRQTGPWVIGAAVAVVIGVAGYEGWMWWTKTQAAKSSDQFYAATKIANGTDIAAAKKALDDLIAQGSGGYPMMAQFREAALLSQNGKTDDAVAAYDALSSSVDNTHLRELALVLAANLLIDKGDVQGVQQRVGGSITPSSPLRDAAREVLGLTQYKAGKLDDAMKSFQGIMDDPLASRDQQQRIQLYMLQLQAEGAKPIAPPSPTTTDASSSAAPTDASSAAPATSSVASASAASSEAASATSVAPTTTSMTSAEVSTSAPAAVSSQVSTDVAASSEPDLVAPVAPIDNTLLNMAAPSETGPSSAESSVEPSASAVSSEAPMSSVAPSASMASSAVSASILSSSAP